MWKSDIEIFALTILPLFPLLLPEPPASITPLLPALLLSLIEFNSAQGDVIDRLRETEKIWFKLFFPQCSFCIKPFFFLYTVPWALQWIASSKLNHHHHHHHPSSSSFFSSSLHTFPPL